MTSKTINLVLSATGALYPAHAGAVYALLKRGYKIKAIAATSGGAIVGSALAVGISPEKMKRIIIDYDPWLTLFDKIELFNKRSWGIYDNKDVKRLMISLGGPTKFKDTKIPITIVGTQVAPSFEIIPFNREAYPEMTLGEATQISSAIPGLFKPVIFDGRTLVDGTLADGLNISAFANDLENTIALSVSIESYQHPKNLWEYVKCCLSLLLTRSRFIYIPPSLRHISIVVNEFASALKFNLSRDERRKLFEIGYDATNNFLDKKETENEC